ncbi:hypothetical protein B5P22_18615 [Pseudomonas tolaasii]|nr:hypothetical protein B5P22_18615 [Pseudomonas tolaasii]
MSLFSERPLWELACVGAGLPAMQTPGVADTLPSQASQLPHLILIVRGGGASQQNCGRRSKHLQASASAPTPRPACARTAT